MHFTTISTFGKETVPLRQQVNFSFSRSALSLKHSKEQKVLKQELRALLRALITKTQAKAGLLCHCNLRDKIGSPAGATFGNTLSPNDYGALFIGKEVRKNDFVAHPLTMNGQLAGLIFLAIKSSQRKPLTKELTHAYAQLIVQKFQTFHKDVEFNRYAEKLEEKKDKLEQLQQYNQNLLRITAHDLSSPLHAVSGYLDMIEDCLHTEKNAEKLQQYYKHIASGVNDVTEMLEQLTEVVKFKNGLRALNSVKVDINWLIKEVCMVLKARADKKNISLHICLNERPAFVSIDIPKFKRIIYNLVANAIKFTQPNRHIYVRVKFDEEHVYLVVKDEGIGISDDDQNTIFEPFIKLKNQKGNPTSQGLGLYISSYFVKLMGGNIQVESQKNQGSTFTVIVPRIRAASGPVVQPNYQSVPQKDIPGSPSMSQLAFKY